MMTDKNTPSTGELWMLTGLGAGLLAGHMVVDQVARFNRSGAPARMLMAGFAPFAIAGWMMSQMATSRLVPETSSPAPTPSRKRVDQATDAEVVVAPRPRLAASPEAPMSPIAVEEVVDVVAALPEHEHAPEAEPEAVMTEVFETEAEPDMAAEAEPEAVETAPEPEVVEPEAAEPEVIEPEAVEPEVVAEAEPEPEAAAEPEMVADAPEAPVTARPTALSEPRMDAPDDLTRIKGVGPKLAEQLNGLGYYHFDQVAAWSAEELEAVDASLVGFSGRATRDDWIGQARALCAGAMH